MKPRHAAADVGSAGNPRADNLFEVVSYLQKREGVRFELKTLSA